MKRILKAMVLCLMIGSFLAACATPTSDKRGYGGKKSTPKQAQEQVVPEGGASQPTPPQPQDEDAPKGTPSKSK